MRALCHVRHTAAPASEVASKREALQGIAGNDQRAKQARYRTPQEPVVALVPATVIFCSAVEVDMVATQVSELHRITIDPDVCGGRLCVRGLRIRVKDVLDLLAAGASHEEVLQDYPYLEPQDVVAVLE